MGLNRQTYGKKMTRTTDLAALCFTVSRSPMEKVQHTSFEACQNQNIAPDQPCVNENLSLRTSSDPEAIVNAYENLSVGDPADSRHTATPKSMKPSGSGTPSGSRALRVRGANIGTGSPQSVRSRRRRSKSHADASPAAIAADLRSALWSQPQSDKAVGMNASPNGTISNVHGSPAQNLRSSAKSRQQSLLSNSPRGLASLPEKPSARPQPTREREESPTPRSKTECLNPYTLYTRPLLELCNDPDGRSAPQPFQPWADSIDEHLNIIKIAEASYGEVYKLSPRDLQISIPRAADSVIKVIALKPPPDVPRWRSKTQQKSIDNMSVVMDVSGEARLLQRMSDVPGFANFRECRVFQGQLPRQLVRAWREFNRNIKRSEFPDPGRRGSYENGQLWAVLEMEDAGNDLEGLYENCLLDDHEDRDSVDEDHAGKRNLNLNQLRTVWGIWDVFWGVALAVAKGEEWARFEHRDLHLGNVCVKSLKQLNISSGKDDIDPNQSFGFTGIETTLIDYTISRADLAITAQKADAEPPVECTTTFFDLSKDPAIFETDGEENYQYDIYRFMRATVLYEDPMAPAKPATKQRGRRGRPHSTQKHSTSPWEQYHPMTNLVWLHFLLYKLTELIVEWPSSCSALAYSQGREMARSVGEKALELEKRLHELTEMLDLHEMKTRRGIMGLASARDLVTWAVEEGWLSEGEALGMPQCSPKSEAGAGSAVDAIAERVERGLYISNEGQGNGARTKGRSNLGVRRS